MNPLDLLAKAARKHMGRLDGLRLSRQTPPTGIHEVNNIAYLPDGNPYHTLDIYSPSPSGTPLPVILNIHGGALVYGDKELNKNYAMSLAKLGFTVVGLSYRLVPEVRFDEQLRDVLAAFRWLAHHARSYSCDVSRLFLTGDSAGALLAVYAALVNNSPTLQAAFGTEGSTLHFRALGLTSGMFYTTEKNSIGYLQPLFFGKGYRRRPHYAAMDLEHLEQAKALPPCYLVTSAQDSLRAQTLRFARLLTQYGIPHTLRDWPEGTEKKLEHVFSIAYPMWMESLDTMQEMTAFFLEHNNSKGGNYTIEKAATK